MSLTRVTESYLLSFGSEDYPEKLFFHQALNQVSMDGIVQRGLLYIVPCARLFIAERRGGLSTVACVPFYIAEGRGQLPTVSCVRLYIGISIA